MISSDFTKSYYSTGFEYIYPGAGNNTLFSIQIGKSTYEKVYLGFLINFKKLDIAYSFIIPDSYDLGVTHKVVLGIDKNILTDYK